MLHLVRQCYHFRNQKGAGMNKLNCGRHKHCPPSLRVASTYCLAFLWLEKMLAVDYRRMANGLRLEDDSYAGHSSVSFLHGQRFRFRFPESPVEFGLRHHRTDQFH